MLDPRSGAPAPAMALLDGTRPLKRWRWVGIFSDELMACAALVEVGLARQSFWALHMRGPGEALRQRTRLRPRRSEVQLTMGRTASEGLPARPGRVLVNDRGVALDVTLEEEPGFQCICPHAAGRVWTRKQAGIPASGTLSLDGGPAREIHALAVIDDTAGHHARVTEWRWSAGVGRGSAGQALAWNLVSGVNDPPEGSERAVWVDGVPSEAPPVTFSQDLTRIDSQDGCELRFTAEAERSRRENLLIVRSDYRAPFGTFSGTLPGAVELARGLRGGRAPPRPLVGAQASCEERWRRSAASSSLECIAPISSRSGCTPAATISIARSTSTSPARRPSSARTSSSTSGSRASR